ncbi:MAG: amidohydrolase family protein [Sphaerochaetaceae bacterium]|nr:amidohydrolase family protein [Sphaerochaetaceae bacterium]
MEYENFVLKGNIIYSKSQSELGSVVQGYLVCKDGLCEGVYEALPQRFSSLPLKDFGNALIVPGLVDLHVHAPQFAYRGNGMDLELMDWLNTYAFPEESGYSDLSYADKAYGIFADSIRKSVTTRAVVFATRHRKATELLMDKMEASGIVSYIGKVNMDRLAPDSLKEESAEESASETVAWIENVAGKYQNTMPILTPRFVPSCTDELMAKLALIRAKYNLPVQSHLSENLGEIQTVKELVPSSRFYGDAYDMYGLFGGPYKCVMAHCVHSEDEEISLMKQRGVFVAHCPESNANIASGIAPVRKYMEVGLNLGLGSDIAGGASLSMFSAIVQTIKYSKLRWRLTDQSLKPLTFAEAFYLGTEGGGKFFGKVGSFKSGYEFDAVVLDDSKYPCAHDLDPIRRLERLAYVSGDDNGVISKFVRGKQIL